LAPSRLSFAKRLEKAVRKISPSFAQKHAVFVSAKIHFFQGKRKMRFSFSFEKKSILLINALQNGVPRGKCAQNAQLLRWPFCEFRVLHRKGAVGASGLTFCLKVNPFATDCKGKLPIC
jgi:hypothetical protein